MRVLLLNQFFWPDSAATSQLLTDVAQELASRGHDVHAICAQPSYAAASPKTTSTFEQIAPAITIHHVKAHSFARGTAGRLLSYASFYAGALTRSLLVSKPDVVLTLTTPPLLSLVGNALQVLRGARHLIWEMDVYPDVAVDLGYMKADGLVAKVVGWLADTSRKRASGVIALGQCMKTRLIARGIPAKHIVVCDNWADSKAIKVLEPTHSGEQLRLLYSGNLGLAHDLDTLTGAISILRNDARFRFLFVGSGGRRDDLAAFLTSQHITSVEMLPYAKREELSESLALGDIGLVTQRDECCGSVVPSKVYGLMAAGRPILFIGPHDATPAAIIRRFGCGWHVACGAVDELVALLLHLAEHRETVRIAGRLSRKALLENYDLPLGTARIVKLLESTLRREHASSSTEETTRNSAERNRKHPTFS